MPKYFEYSDAPAFEDLERGENHDCGWTASSGDCGPAIRVIVKAKDAWWAWNEEYATAIDYCPFCGVRL